MSNMMIYAPLSATGGNIENVYGTKMRVRVIDASNKDEVEQAKADGWMPKADDVIEQIETEKLEAENKVMKSKLDGGRAGDTVNNSRIDELEKQLAEALTEVAQLEAKLAIYEETKDVNGDGVVSYDEMTIPMLSTLLKNREVEHNVRDGKDALIKLAQDSE